MADRVTILGARGSMPVSGAEYLRYGGSTTCVLAELDGQFIVLDAGTGILHLPDEVLRLPRLTLLLSHPHIDHLLGLPMCPYLFRGGAHLSICSVKLEERGPLEQTERFLSPPLWPVGLEEMPAEVSFHELTGDFRIGPVHVEYMSGVHPGGVTVFRLTGSRNSIVFATDCKLTERFQAELQPFAQGCSLLLCDGQYAPEDWEMHRQYGHSTWEMAAAFGRGCAAGAVRIIHHDPSHTDSILDAASESVKAVCPECSLAKEGEVIVL